MVNVLLTKEQIRQLVHSWQNAPSGSQEQKLIEDLFLITETPMPVCAGLQRVEAA